MSFLKAEFMEKNKIEKDFETAIHYPTGFTEFDYRNGYKIQMAKDNKIVDGDTQIGLAGGTITAFIGPSGSGKTTFALQSIINMAKPFKDTLIIHFDLEKGAGLSRLVTISGLSPEWFKEHYIRKESTTAEEFFDFVKSHCELKLAHKEELLYDTKVRDELGKEIKTLVPSFIILDSLALLMPSKNVEEEGTGTNMTPAQAARANSVIFKKIMPLLTSANVQLIFINHLGEAIQTSMYQAPKKQVNIMKQGESMPGGKTAIYLCNNIIKLEGKSKFKEDDKYKMDGFPVTCTIYKSRSNRAGQEFEMLYSQTFGFNNPMSLFHRAKEAGIITGSAYLELPGYDKKFRNGEFITKYAEDKDFKEAFDKAIQPLLISYLVSGDTGQREFSPEKLNKQLEELGLTD
ncbi:hypothetical protein DLH72_04605 [Candidatus Gracilibacteria bacterium]|nr:MAG: hypothetical protein DLH72_04605 [Candidatus Gracilibacteria bacterium]